MKRYLCGLLAMLLFGTLSASLANAGDGTLGYSGSKPFNLSTINSLFQIDVDGVSQIAGQPAEPDDAVAIVTSFSLDPFNLSTPGQQTDCGAGIVCPYNWSGNGVPIGATFDLNFASPAGDRTYLGGAVALVPEPASIVLLGTVLLLTCGALRKKMARRSQDSFKKARGLQFTPSI